jgi:hypothetical protein
MKIEAGLGLLLVASLAACGQEKDDIRLQEVACPSVAVPAYGGELVQWAGQGHDLSNLAYRIKVSDAEGSCTRKSNNNNLFTKIAVTIDATRGPAMQGRDIAAQYFVAVVRQGQIIDEQTYAVAGSFAPNTDHLTIPNKPVTMTLPISSTLAGSDYSIEVFMQLTQAQIDENRALSQQ